MAEVRSGDGPSIERLALLLHEGPVQVLSAVALRLELMGRELVDEDSEQLLAAADAVRSAVLEIQRHATAELDRAPFPAR